MELNKFINGESLHADFLVIYSFFQIVQWVCTVLKLACALVFTISVSEIKFVFHLTTLNSKKSQEKITTNVIHYI